MSTIRSLHRVLIVTGYVNSIFPGQSERKFLILAQKQFRKTTCFSPIYGGVCCAKTLLSCFFFLALSGNFHVFWKFDHNNTRGTQYVPGSTRRHSDVAFFCTANLPITSVKGICKDAFLISKKERTIQWPTLFEAHPRGRRTVN